MDLLSTRLNRWKKGSFQQMYAEARAALASFYEYTGDLLASCNDGVECSVVKSTFEVADEYYKKATEIGNHLSLWHGGKVEGKAPSEWTEREREQSVLIEALRRMTSSCMYHLLSVSHAWSAKADRARVVVNDEDEVGAP
jgi:hypothetical protein